MTARATLHSRLRVLVAKTFRAEQLYASMRNSPKQIPEELTKSANDYKADVWQRCHRELRDGLNEALELANKQAVASRIQTLRNSFRTKSEQATILVDHKSDQLVDATNRHEFALALKLALELVGQKASSQANQVIADELAEILQQTGKQNVQAEDPADVEATTLTEPTDSPPKELPSNVIPLRKRFSVGR